MLGILMFYVIGSTFNLLICSLHVDAYKVKLVKVNLLTTWGKVFVLITTLLSWIGIFIHLLALIVYLVIAPYIKD